jgi:hypothetical protein
VENKKKKVSAIMRRRFGLSVDNSALVTKATPTTAVPNLTSPLIDPPREAESMKIIWRIHIVRFLFGSQQVSSQEWMQQEKNAERNHDNFIFGCKGINLLRTLSHGMCLQFPPPAYHICVPSASFPDLLMTIQHHTE